MIRLLTNHVKFNVGTLIVALAFLENFWRRLIVSIGQGAIENPSVKRLAHWPLVARIFHQFRVHKTTATPFVPSRPIF